MMIETVITLLQKEVETERNVLETKNDRKETEVKNENSVDRKEKRFWNEAKTILRNKTGSESKNVSEKQKRFWKAKRFWEAKTVLRSKNGSEKQKLRNSK